MNQERPPDELFRPVPATQDARLLSGGQIETAVLQAEQHIDDMDEGDFGDTRGHLLKAAAQQHENAVQSAAQRGNEISRVATPMAEDDPGYYSPMENEQPAPRTRGASRKALFSPQGQHTSKPSGKSAPRGAKRRNVSRSQSSTPSRLYVDPATHGGEASTREILNAMMRKMGEGKDELMEKLSEVQKDVSGVRTEIAAVEGKVDKQVKALADMKEDMLEKIGENTQAVEAVRQATENQAKRIGDVAKDVEKFQESLTKVQEAAKVSEKVLEEFQEELKTQVTFLDGLSEDQNSFRYDIGQRLYSMDKVRRREIERDVMLTCTDAFPDKMAGLGKLTNESATQLLRVPNGTTVQIMERFKPRDAEGKFSRWQAGDPCERMEVRIEDLDTVQAITYTGAARREFENRTGLRVHAKLTELEQDSKQHLQKHAMGIIHASVPEKRVGWRRGELTWFVQDKSNFACLSKDDVPAQFTVMGVPVPYTLDRIKAIMTVAEERIPRRQPRNMTGNATVPSTSGATIARVVVPEPAQAREPTAPEAMQS